MKVIAIEEHFVTQTTLKHRRTGPRHAGAMADGQIRNGGADILTELLTLGDSRIKAMDEAGVDLAVLSLNSPGAQGFEPDVAVPMAREANDIMHEAVKKHPTRYAAFAALATADPKEAVKELERTVKLGFKGAMINGRSPAGYLDDKKFLPIFEAAEALDVAIYLHPRDPHPDVMKAYFENFWEVSDAAWGFGMETGTHFLRIMLSGVFDRHPKLKFILGHLGEGLLFWLPRMDEHARGEAKRKGLKKTPKEYLTENLLVSTSGHFSNAAFACVAETIGIDKIMFAVDWPFESNKTGTDWLKQLNISPTDLHKVAHGNAERILKL